MSGQYSERIIILSFLLVGIFLFVCLFTKNEFLLFHLKNMKILMSRSHQLHDHKSLQYIMNHVALTYLSPLHCVFCVDKTENSLSLAKLGLRDN